MKIRELNELLDGRFPPALSCDWDNDGLLVSPDPDATVSGVLVALDPSDAAIDEAEKRGCNVLLTHHPLRFDRISSFTPENGVSRRVLRLLSLGISTVACHTRADAAKGGVNDALAALLGLSDVVPFGDGIPRIGALPAPLPVREAVAGILGATGAKTALYSGKAPGSVFTVAVCGGSGKDCLSAAAEAGADLYLTGELSYHARLDAADLPTLVCEIGHDASEMHVVNVFSSFLAAAAPGLRVETFPYYPGDGFSGARLDI